MKDPQKEFENEKENESEIEQEGENTNENDNDNADNINDSEQEEQEKIKENADDPSSQRKEESAYIEASAATESGAASSAASTVASGAESGAASSAASTAASDSESAEASRWDNVVNSEQMQQAKLLSKNYIQYFISVFKRPFDSFKETNEEHFPNALITIGLVAVLCPIFIVLFSVRMGIRISFADMVLQPLLFAIIGMAAAIGAIILILKWQGVDIDYKRATVQYATLLVPAPICLEFTILVAIFGLSISMTFFLVAAVIVFMLVAMNLVILSYPAATTPKIDLLYSLVIANLVVGFFFYRLIASAISIWIAGTLSGFLPF